MLFSVSFCLHGKFMKILKYLCLSITTFSVTLLSINVSVANEVQPDWTKMIECRASFDDYTSFAMGDFQNEAFKTKLEKDLDSHLFE